MQLMRQSVEAWQNEKHYSKGNNTSENPIPRQEIFKPADHVKYEGQVRSQNLLFAHFLLEFSSCRVTYENCYKSLLLFFYLVRGEWMDLRNSKKFGFELMQISISFITVPPRTPGDLHQKFAPNLGLLHPSFCPGGGDLLG